MTQDAILAAIKPILDKYDVPLALIETIIEVESNWNPTALGDNGTSIGLFQLHSGGQADKAIAEGHPFVSLDDPLLNAEYGMPAIASAWDNLKASFKADDFTWWLHFAVESGHPGGSSTNTATFNEARRLQDTYHGLITQGGQVSNTLKNFPMIPERTPITADGHPSENAGLDCVPASLCAGAMFLNGIKSLGGIYTPDAMKDAVYGQDYVGGMTASAYISYMHTLGIDLVSFGGTPTELVAEVHKAIQVGHPVIFTEANPYGNPIYTHVCIFFGESPGTLVSMDPWIAQAVTHSDAVWENTLLNNEVWIMSPITLTLPQHLKDAGWIDDGHTLWSNGPGLSHIPIISTFREHILTASPSWRADNYAEAPAVHLSPLEGSNPSIGPGTVQIFRFNALEIQDGKDRVFELSTGQELQWTRVKLADALTKLNALIQHVAHQQKTV